MMGKMLRGATGSEAVYHRGVWYEKAELFQWVTYVLHCTTPFLYYYIRKRFGVYVIYACKRIPRECLVPGVAL